MNTSLANLSVVSFPKYTVETSNIGLNIAKIVSSVSYRSLSFHKMAAATTFSFCSHLQWVQYTRLHLTEVMFLVWNCRSVSLAAKTAQPMSKQRRWIKIYHYESCFGKNYCLTKYSAVKRIVQSYSPGGTHVRPRLKRGSLGRVGIAGGVGGLNPTVHVYIRSFLSENRFKISIPVQNFKHFDIWPPSSFRSIPTLSLGPHESMFRLHSAQHLDSGMTKSKGTSFWNFLQTLEWEKFFSAERSPSLSAVNKRPLSLCCWQHLANTVDVARCCEQSTADRPLWITLSV